MHSTLPLYRKRKTVLGIFFASYFLLYIQQVHSKATQLNCQPPDVCVFHKSVSIGALTGGHSLNWRQTDGWTEGWMDGWTY